MFFTHYKFQMFPPPFLALQDMKGNNNNAYSDNSDSETIGSEPAGFSSTKRHSKKSVRFNDDEYVEVILGIRDDSVMLHSVQYAPGAELEEDPKITYQAKKKQEERFSSSTASLPSRTAAPCRYDRSKSAVAQALVGFKFIATTRDGVLMNWNRVEKLFDTLHTNGLLPYSEFGKCIGMSEDSYRFAEELFASLARRFNISRNSINKEELFGFWMQISDTNFDSRLQIFFDMVDKDADGRITESDVAEIIRLSALANKLSAIHEQANKCAAMIMEELDPDNLGYIEMFSLEAFLMENATPTSLESKNLSRLMSQKLKPVVETNSIERWYKETKYFLMDNWKRVWILALWLVILAGLFVNKFVQYMNKPAYSIMGYCVCTAKGAAETLKFNMALILLPVCRNTITWLRNKTKIGLAVPFDDNLNFHTVIAIAISVGVVLHGGAHLTCDFPRLLHATKEEYEPLENYFGEKQPDNYWWFVKGVAGVTGTVMVVLMVIAFALAAPWFRNNKLLGLLKKLKLPALLKKLKLPALLKKLKLPDLLAKLTGFNAFWYTHHLFVIVYTLLIVHGYYLYLTHIWYQKTTWMYLTVPMLLYGCERLIRAFRSSIKPVKILKVTLCDTVLSLHIVKPKGFQYSSGQYMFIKCREVSPFEWHPFSITSAPLDNYLSVHIRALGDWTKQLKTEFAEACNHTTGEFWQGENNREFPRISIDGPYGAPAQEYKNYEVVLLVGLGIGATPMVSIVKDIINNFQNIDRDLENGGQAPSNQKSPSPLLPSSPNNTKNKKNNTFNTKQAYFYWVTREQESFEWFRGIMNEVADMDKEKIIELHNYCSNVYEEGDARSTLITMLQTLHHAKNGVDLVGGTRVITHFSKPNWREVFKKVAIHHPDTRVGVFYCGAAAAVNELKNLAVDFSHKTSTKFEFHKENF